MSKALAISVTGLGGISAAALASQSKVTQSFGLMGAAAIGTAGVTAAVVGTFGALAAVAARLSDAVNNASQAFGEFSSQVESSAERQQKAFGRTRAEMLSYATEVGTELQTLGFSEQFSAAMALKVMEATNRLAASRRISADEAFRQIQSGKGLYDPIRIRALAAEQGALTARNEYLSKGGELLLRYELGLEAVATQTSNLAQADESWSNQLVKLQGNISELATKLGSELMPGISGVIGGFQMMLADLESTISGIQKFLRLYAVAGTLASSNPFHPLANFAEAQKRIDLEDAAKAANAGAPIAGKAEELERIRRQVLFGQALASGGGGGGTGYQGSAATLHQHIQAQMWNSRQAENQEKQLRKLEQIATLLGLMVGDKNTTNSQMAGMVARGLFGVPF
jgi:hypothetical protein